MQNEPVASCKLQTDETSTLLLGGGDLRPGSDQPSKGKASGVERNREADSRWRDGPRPKRVLRNIMCTLSPGTYWQLVGTKRMAALQTRHDEG